jgi:hypothetical protein
LVWQDHKEASMDEFIWKVIRLAIRSADRSIPRTGRRPRYGDALIVRM